VAAPCNLAVLRGPCGEGESWRLHRPRCPSALDSERGWPAPLGLSQARVISPQTPLPGGVGR
jgi:hypothetical protein